MKTASRLLCFFVLTIPLISQTSVPRYGVLEIDLPFAPAGVTNPWEQVSVAATFTAPSGRIDTVGGFYFGTNLWKLRFAPDETGVWSWSATIADPNGSSRVSGSFTCLPSSAKGFIRRHPTNPRRWICEADSSLFSGIGFGDCMGSDTNRSIFSPWGFDGGIRMTASHGEAPAWSEPLETYLTAYGDVAGFNLLRISDGNCAFSIKKTIAPSGNAYSDVYSRRADTICAAFRAHGFRIYYDIGGWNPPFINSSSDTARMSAVKRWAKYCVDRWSAYVDFWELMNEKSGVDDHWYTIVADYIRSIDPYRHPISTSYEQPAHPAIDIISPHWYGTEAATQSDLEVANRLAAFRAYNKPVMYGEQGNSGRNWDSTSALRMRGRIWSALFNEGILMFWNSSYARDNGGGAANLYLGAEERRSVAALQRFAAQLDKDVAVAPVPVQSPGIRSYGLRSGRLFAAYLRSGASIAAVNSGVAVDCEVPEAGVASWYDVKSGRVITTLGVGAGQHRFTAPDFVCDIALLIGPAFPPAPDHFRVAIDARDIGFDSVAVGGSREIATHIRNVGDSAVTIQAISSTGGFPQYFSAASRPLPFLLAPRDSAELRIRYAPAAAGLHTAHVAVSHDGSPVPEFIAVKGKGIVATGVREQAPSALVLEQNFPNPAAGAATIRFSCRLQGTGVTLRVRDALGRRCLTLFEGEASGGMQAVSFDAGSLPAGPYCIELLAGGSRLSRRMVVLR